MSKFLRSFRNTLLLFLGVLTLLEVLAGKAASTLESIAEAWRNLKASGSVNVLISDLAACWSGAWAWAASVPLWHWALFAAAVFITAILRYRLEVVPRGHHRDTYKAKLKTKVPRRSGKTKVKDGS